MTRRIRALNSGRARIWWVHHGREAKNALALVCLVACYLIASTMDHQDQLDAEKSARDEVAATLAAEREARGIPRIAFVIEASSPKEAALKLADIEGAAMAERYKLWSAK